MTTPVCETTDNKPTPVSPQTVADLQVGHYLEPQRPVYYLGELSGGYRKLVVERPGGTAYTAIVHGSTPLSEARGGGSYNGDTHLATS